MKRLKVIRAACVAWTMVAAAAEATPVTAIGDHESGPAWIASATLDAVHNAPAVIPPDPVGSAVVVGTVLDERVRVPVVDLENPGDQLAFDLAALTIATQGSQDVPGPTVLALVGAGLAGLALMLRRRHGRAA